MRTSAPVVRAALVQEGVLVGGGAARGRLATGLGKSCLSLMHRAVVRPARMGVQCAHRLLIEQRVGVALYMMYEMVRNCVCLAQHSTPATCFDC